MDSSSLGGWGEGAGIGVTHAPGQEANADDIGMSSIFYRIMLCWVYSLESLRCFANEYTQHTFSC